MHVGGVESGLQTVADSVMLISESNGILQFPVPLELGHILFTLHSCCVVQSPIIVYGLLLLIVFGGH
jgi:hypothetical protein